MRSLLLALPLLTSFQGAVSQSVKSCGGVGDHLKNPVIKLAPDPPVKGGSLTIETSGTLDEVEGDFNSNVDLQITALGVVHAAVKGSVPMSISPGAVAGPFSLTVGPFSLPSNVPGSAVVKGQVHVVNGKNEPIMCIDLDLDVPAESSEEAHASVNVDTPPLEAVTSCGKSSDHIPDFKIASAGGVTTMTGTLDEAVTKASVNLDVALKVLFISVPLKMNIPIDVSSGLINKGAIKSTIGPSTIVVSPDVKASLKGTVTINDGSNQQITCLNVDTVVDGITKDEVSTAASVVAPLNCKKTSYAFCCEVGSPCDCTKGTTSPGQCKPESYAFCCSVGTPCDCTKPPFMDIVGGHREAASELGDTECKSIFILPHGP